MYKFLIVVFTTLLSINISSLYATIPADVFIMRNGIVVFESIGQLDVPLYLSDSYTGTITYEWCKKERTFGVESPAAKPFRTARCEYIKGYLDLYYPSDRNFVYRFFWNGNNLQKIETYNRDGKDICKRSYEYQWPVSNGSRGMNVYIARNRYDDGQSSETYYECSVGKYFPLTIGNSNFDKKGRYKNGSYFHVGWIGRDGRVQLKDDIEVYKGWNLVQGKIRFYPQGREDSPMFYYGEANQTSDFYLYIYK